MDIAAADPDSGDARLLIAELSATLAAITGDSGQASFSVDDVRAEGGVFLLARAADGTALGCGALRRLDDATGEIKRMYARPGTAGVGAALLARLEDEARRLAYSRLWLETRKINQLAVSFYLRNGYTIIPNYGKYRRRDEAVCLEKVFMVRPGH